MNKLFEMAREHPAKESKNNPALLEMNFNTLKPGRENPQVRGEQVDYVGGENAGGVVKRRLVMVYSPDSSPGTTQSYRVC